MNIFEMFEVNKKSRVAEAWSQKYKSSINCSHPRGFSQKAHCAGKKKHNESVDMEMTCEDCGMCETHGDHLHSNLDEACWKGYHKEGMKKMFGKTYPNCVKNKNESLETYVRKGQCPGCGETMVAESQLNEKQDACYHKVKSRYKVWPSAYASGALVKCRKKGAANWGNSNESITQEEYDKLDENLKQWFSDKWVRFGPDGKIRGDCARGDSSEGKPKCLPQSKAHSLGKKGRASAAARKRRQDPNPERSGKAINVNTAKKEAVAEAKHQPQWTVEQHTNGHHNAFYIVRGHDRPREVWKDAQGRSDFKNCAAAEAKAAELNQPGVAEANFNPSRRGFLKKAGAAAVATAMPRGLAGAAMKAVAPAVTGVLADKELHNLAVSSLGGMSGKDLARAVLKGGGGEVSANQAAYMKKLADEWGLDLTDPTDQEEFELSMSDRVHDDYLERVADASGSRMAGSDYGIDDDYFDKDGKWRGNVSWDADDEGGDSSDNYVPGSTNAAGLARKFGDWINGDDVEPMKQMPARDMGRIEPTTAPAALPAPTMRTGMQIPRQKSKVAAQRKDDEELADGEPIQELSSDALDRYKVKAKQSADELTSLGKYRQANDRTMNVMKATGKQIDNTVTNIRKALNRESTNQGVAEGSAGETPQQQKVRTAISNGLAKSSQMGKSEYQSQPTKRTYFDNAGYASDKLTGIDSIDPDGTVVISMGDTKAANWVKKLATLGGMPGVKTREVQPQKQGVAEDAEQLNVGDDVIITGDVQFNGATGVIDSFGRDHRFVVVNLYNHGRHSFHSSDVSFNDYADSDDEQARMYDAGEFRGHTDDDIMESRLQQMRDAGYDIL